jgi:ketosteroid isomerase-like protein
MSEDRVVLLRRIYEAFNGRDVDGVLGLMVEDVDWPNAWEGERAVGHEAVRDYWTRQWAEIDSRVEPVGFAERPDGTIAVEVHQRATSVATGDLLTDGRVVHVYAFDDANRVVGMDVEAA